MKKLIGLILDYKDLFYNSNTILTSKVAIRNQLA